MLMYLILVVQFGSFLDPLAILMSLPLSLIGVLLALAVSGMTVNLMSLIGVILLMGIVAKNAILLIDFAKWAREKEGMPLREALIEAGAIRLRPILMTTFALIAGMIPVALGRGEGAQFRAPLGMAIIGGVLTSTLLTLLVIPTFYEVMDEWRHALARRFGFTPPMTAEHPVPRGAVPSRRAPVRRATLRLILGVVVLDAVAMAIYYLSGIAHATIATRQIFVVVWTVATALTVAVLLKRVRTARFANR
jgi:predicted RND superfamily exporter protein